MSADQISDKTKIPIGWAISIIAGLVTGVSSAAVAQYRIGVHEDEIKELKSDLKEKAKADVERDLSLRDVSGKLDNLDEKIDEVKESINKLERSISRQERNR